MVPETGHGAAVTRETTGCVSPESREDPPSTPAPPHDPRHSLGHAAGGAAVIGLFQAYHADHGATIERRHDLAPASLPLPARAPSLPLL